MVNATAMVVPQAYNYLVNETNMSIVRASIDGWKQSGDGIAAFFVFTFIILLAGIIVYIRTEQEIPTILVTLIMMFVADYYGLFENILFGWEGGRIFTYIGVGLILIFAMAIYKIWK